MNLSNEIIYIYEKSTSVSFSSYSICDFKIIWVYREYLGYVNLGINVVLSSTDFWRKIYTIKVLLSYIRSFRWHSLAMGRFTYYVMVFFLIFDSPSNLILFLMICDIKLNVICELPWENSKKVFYIYLVVILRSLPQCYPMM